jgi:hypothetical protein
VDPGEEEQPGHRVELVLDAPIPEGAIVARAIVVAELVLPDGERILQRIASPGLAGWDAAMLARAGGDAWDGEVYAGWARPDE